MPTIEQIRKNRQIIDAERFALGRLKAAMVRANEGQRSKLHARASVINADLIDRTIGLTVSESTFGSVMAFEIAGLFSDLRAA